jgi:sigma-B regulation protein RsbU (phosphoserine phosphatase)
MFGLDRLVSALDAASDKAPEQLLKTVLSTVDGFAGDAEQFDDLTMLCLEYKGNQSV